MGNVREYKSDVFSMLMQDKKNALQVYNALNGTNYTDENMVEIVTLEEGVSLSIRNDSAFVVKVELTVQEHQATYNPNMPLRGLFYYTTTVSDMIKKRDLYGRKKVEIPVPHFVVFYNGEEDRPEKEIQRLSDLYARTVEEPELELICTVYNINKGMNKKLLEDCPVLRDYMIFVNEVRGNKKAGMELEAAVKKAIDDCIRNHVLEDFLRKRKEEVLHVMTLDYTWERREELIRQEEYEEGKREGRREGQKEGRREGRKEGRREGQKQGEEIGQRRGEKIGQKRGEKIGQETLVQLYIWLRENGRSEEAEKMMQPGNRKLREALMEEYWKSMDLIP